jgi:hypothetical protein
VFAKAPSAQDGEVEPRIAAPVAVRKKFGKILMTVIVLGLADCIENNKKKLKKAAQLAFLSLTDHITVFVRPCAFFFPPSSSFPHSPDLCQFFPLGKVPSIHMLLTGLY